MTYWLLNLVFLGIVAIMAIAARLARRAPRWRAIGLTAIAVLVTSIVFDNLMIGVGLVAYDPAHISGAKLGIAPIEDFAYALAAVVLLPSLWMLLPGSRRARPTGSAGSTDPAGPTDAGPTDAGHP